MLTLLSLYFNPLYACAAMVTVVTLSVLCLSLSHFWRESSIENKDPDILYKCTQHSRVEYMKTVRGNFEQNAL